MSQDTPTTASGGPPFLGVGAYKPNQGKIARRLTGAAIAVIAFFAAWSLQASYLADSESSAKWIAPGIILFGGMFVAHRIINRAKFAEFLISTESEVDKVNWPDKEYVHRATIVVLVTMFTMGILLFVFDIIWQWVFELLGFLELEAATKSAEEAVK